jgi:hypothetical protein
MKNLIAKELKLSVGISSIIYLIIGILVEFAPNYPKYIPCLFICIGLFMIFKTGSVNKDLLYTACLPVRKSDTVKARVIIFAFSEVLQLILCIPLIFLSKELKLTNNAGIDLNFAFIGLAFTFYAVFNFVFLTSFYKKGGKEGGAYLKSMIILLIYMIILEIPVFLVKTELPFAKIGRLMDSTEYSDMIKQLPFVAAGLIIWIVGLFITCKVCIKKFEKIDL